MPFMRPAVAFLIGVLILSASPHAGAESASPAADAGPQFAIVVDASLLAIQGGIPQLGRTVADPGWQLVQAFPFASVMVLSVVRGALMVRSDGPLAIVRDGTARAIQPGTDAATATGDTVVYRSDARTQQRNDGSDAAEYYWMLVSARMPPSIEETIGTSTGEVIGGLGPDQWTAPARGPVTITLRIGGGTPFTAGSQVISGTADGQSVELAFTTGALTGATPVNLAGAGPSATPATTG